jgi:hypothetical protein
MSNSAEEYRRRANECLAVARTVSNPQGRASLETIAQMWFRLADELEGPVTRTGSTGDADSRPLIQQQQPQQPDDSEKE